MANVDYVCPAFHPMLSIDEDYGVHTKEFADTMKIEKTHEAIKNGGDIITRFIMRVWEEPKLLEAIKDEHEKLEENRRLKIILTLRCGRISIIFL